MPVWIGKASGPKYEYMHSFILIYINIELFYTHL